jgi:hypothetical protein
MFMRSRAVSSAALVCLMALPTLAARAQQMEVRRYDVYAGFAGFETPELNLAQRGFHLQAGQSVRTWLSVGFDYSEGTGHNSLTPNLLKPSLQQELGGEIQGLILAGLIPANYTLVVPTNAASQTFAFGPQVEYRHYKAVTLFLRPSLGAIRQRVTPRPADPVATAIVAQLVPAGSKLDWTGFYGFGGGFDWNATRYFGLRVQTDLVYWRLFNDLLANGTWTTRYAIGPTFHLGRNIASRSH